MRRSTLMATLLLMGLSAVPVAGQDYTWRPNKPEYQWDVERPDSRAPAGVSMDKIYQKGELSLAYRFNHLNEEDTHLGTDLVPVDALLREFPTVALNTNRWRHDLEFALGLSETFTLGATLPIIFSRTDNLTSDFTFYQTESEGLGDFQAFANLALYNEGAYRFHLTGAVSVPTGSIDQTSVTPFSTPSEEQLPYTMQNGSGTFDVTPGATLQAQNELGTVGFQALATIRLGTNDRDYKYGNRFVGNIWGAIKATDGLSASFRVQYAHNADLKGMDIALDPFSEPAANPLFQSGTRVVMPLGLNVFFKDGALDGHRMTGEYVIPIHHDLNGLQLGANWGLQFRWEAVF
jgi:hypothetical protein